MAKLFPSQPPALGKPTTLVCLVENIFPPAVDITWRVDDVPVTHGVTHTDYTATDIVSFIRFSYLQVTPSTGATYSCVVTSQGLNRSTVAYWGEHGDNNGGTVGTTKARLFLSHCCCPPL